MSWLHSVIGTASGFVICNAVFLISGCATGGAAGGVGTGGVDSRVGLLYVDFLRVAFQ